MDIVTIKKEKFKEFFSNRKEKSIIFNVEYQINTEIFSSQLTYRDNNSFYTPSFVNELHLFLNSLYRNNGILTITESLFNGTMTKLYGHTRFNGLIIHSLCYKQWFSIEEGRPTNINCLMRSRHGFLNEHSILTIPKDLT